MQNAQSTLASAQNQRRAVSINLDAIRGVAALAVFASHLRALFFVDYEQATHKGPLVKLAYLLTGLGHEAVVVFFVLSGYLIAGSLLKAEAKGRWSGPQYAFNRLTRLYVVLLPALLLGAFWDRFGLYLFPQSGVYTGAFDYHLIVPVAVAHSASWSSWIGSLFYMQGILVRPFGSNGPLWSLSYEFWYYALFPLLWLAGSPKRKPFFRSGCLFLALIIALFVGKTILLYFVIWLLGAALNILPRRRAGVGNGITAVAFGLFAGTLLMSRLRVLHDAFLMDLVIGIVFTFALYMLLHTRRETVPQRYARAAMSLSGISYTMYLVHVPFLVFVNGLVLNRQERWQPGLASGLTALAIALVTMGYVWMVWRLTEANTDWIRDHLKISGKNAAPITAI
jgi:peptidoglycan/LPS O-acetylase OafA/YrhL